ncbi:MAG TPA: hypothetical protein VFF69_00565 [Phycisphaerales bacterium]|nr:hypothetical protein [Phycisphaerales bacterium]
MRRVGSGGGRAGKPWVGPVAAVLACAAACEREPTYQNAGERLDAAIRRVEELKTELREAEVELQAARAALGDKVDRAPEDVSEVPAPAPDPGG